MKTAKDIWNNIELRCGGFYELAIEVSDNNKSRTWIERCLNAIFELDFIKGPFDHDLNNTRFYLDLEFGYGENLGYLKIADKELPFKIVFISEEGQNESNWISLCFYTAMYEQLLGKEYQTWAINAKWHQGLDNKLITILNYLNNTQKIRMGLLGFEVSGQYYLKSLKENELTYNDVSHTKFYVNKNEKLKGNNWEFVNEITLDK